ncbi:MAG: histidine phosphatase family protein [Acidimicrobiales bacterium]|jgi:probable phosphoglycerate mutase|uniref:Histidine phosphatase family protein n=1 Tax=marine metagenome TaxID=408172 RepID=A0A381RSJ2_9ZZZZ|nr:histidine phosphatase family protein [Acidimicrobiales bacterium]|tara:strand:+ start:442 stop:1062 length:621 start_codon:yes stop_codon:yes gene_type:complete
MELLLIRHALPTTVDNRDTGREADPDLSNLGRRQAAALADWLCTGPTAEPVDAVYASPKARAVQTVAPLAERLGLEVAIEPLVNEYDAGEPEYVPMERLRALGDPRWGAIMAGEDLDDPESFRDQVVVGMERIIAANPGRTVAVGCHGGVVAAYLSHVLGTDRVMFFEARYTAISRVAASSSGHRSLRSVNELGHLRLAGIPLSDV